MPGVCGVGFSMTWCPKHLSKQWLEEPRWTAEGGVWHSSRRWRRGRDGGSQGESAAPQSWQPHSSGSLPTNSTRTHRIGQHQPTWSSQLHANIRSLPWGKAALALQIRLKVSAERSHLVPFLPVIFSVFISPDICFLMATFISCPPSFLCMHDKLIWSWRRTMELNVIADNNWAKYIWSFFLASFFPNVSASPSSLKSNEYGC